MLIGYLYCGPVSPWLIKFLYFVVAVAAGLGVVVILSVLMRLRG